jgi:hypothetical protein
MASRSPSWLAIADLQSGSGVVDLLRSCSGTRSLVLGSCLGHSLT